MENGKWTPQITSGALTKITAFVDNAEDEIGGLLKVETTEEGQIRVVDVAIIKQKATSGDFRISDNGLLEFYQKVIDTEGLDAQSKWCGWFHKHPCDGWSCTDDNTFKRLLTDWNGFCLGIVKQGNEGRFLWRLDTARMKSDGTTDNVFTIETERHHVIFTDETIEKDCKEMIKKLVKKPKIRQIIFKTAEAAGKAVKALEEEYPWNMPSELGLTRDETVQQNEDIEYLKSEGFTELSPEDKEILDEADKITEEDIRKECGLPIAN